MLQTRKRKREPIPGYRLLEPLGRGGFGEVWKCEAPGGLYKAIKFVEGERGLSVGDIVPAVEELRAIQHIKSLRHPFLLSMERVERIDGELVIVMELADRSLMDVFNEYRTGGGAGVPRTELLNYLHEAADVLDLMNLRHGLQHLDIKPANLFLVSNHVKVADFGLVRSLSDRNGSSGGPLLAGGLTAPYAAPEMFGNTISPSCDQYSLAIVYQELLTGSRPFNGKNARQLMLQHSTAEPDLRGLPEGDRPAVARALAKNSAERFPTCTAFVQALRSSEKSQFAVETIIDVNLGSSAETTRGARTDGGTARRSAATERGPASARWLPDYQFQSCLSRSPFGESWEARTPQGKRRLVKILYVGTGADAARERQTIAGLQGLRHPQLPEMRVLSGGPGCLIVDTELLTESLRERFQEHRRRGERGIPRRLLLGWLRRAAEALDELSRRHGLHHLGLNPRCLLLDGDDIRIADFGLLPLVWQPAGQLPAQLQARYAAPELLEGQGGAACDSYSLAVMFQEMLTGTTPWRGRRAGLPSLEALSLRDRSVLARALDIDPAQRFATCTELIAALDEDRPRSSTAPTDGPSGTSALLAELIVEAKGVVSAIEGSKATPPNCGALHARFPARLPSNNPHAGFEAFRRQWNAQVIHAAENALVFQVPLPGRFWQRWMGGARGLLVETRWTRPHAVGATLPELSIFIRGPQKKSSSEEGLIHEVGPLLLDSLRGQLEAYPERRAQERIAWPYPVRANFPDAEEQPGEVIEGKGKDISLGGMGLYLPRVPAGSRIQLELLTASRSEPIILTGQCVRVQRCRDGWFETGVLF